MDASASLAREDILLGRLLVDAEFLSRDQLYDCVELQKMYGDGRPIGSIFLEMGYLTEDELDAILAIQAEYVETLELQAFLASDLEPLVEAAPAVEAPPPPKRKGKKKKKAAAAPPPEPVAEPEPAPAEVLPEPAPPISEYYTYKVKAIRTKPMRDGRHPALALPGDWITYLLEKAIAVAVVGMALVMVLLVVFFVRNRFATDPEEAEAPPRKVRATNHPPPRNAPPPVANLPAHETPPHPENGTAAVRPDADKYGAIAGTVLGPDGAAVADLAVTITDPDGGGMAASTGADGTFILQHLPPGSFTVSIQDAQNRGKIPAEGYEDQKVAVEAGRTARVRFGGSAQAGASLLGGVFEEGHAVPGAFVTLVYLGGGGESGPGEGMDTMNATADARGEFRFPSLPPGSYSLLATHPSDPTRTARAMVDLPDGGERRRDLRFSTLLLRGRALDSKNSAPLPGVSVFLQKEDGGGDSAKVLETLVSLQVMSTFTDESGRFEFTSMESGTYTAVASVEGYATRAVAGIQVDERSGVQDIEIALSSGGGVLEGTLKKKSGDIPPNTYVAIRDASNNVISLRRVDHKGEFEVDGLAPGAYRAVIFCAGEDGQIRFFTVASDGVMSQEFEIP